MAKKTKPYRPPKPLGRPRVDKPKRRRRPKLNPNDPKYYEKLGGRGGEQTLKRNGPAYFQYIARLSHQKRRENKIKRQNAARAANPGA
jgi:hypothetical protein